jgi:hypothetical protein
VLDHPTTTHPDKPNASNKPPSDTSNSRIGFRLLRLGCR